MMIVTLADVVRIRPSDPPLAPPGKQNLGQTELGQAELRQKEMSNQNVNHVNSFDVLRNVSTFRNDKRVLKFQTNGHLRTPS